MQKIIDINISSNGGTIIGKTYDDGSYSAGKLSLDEINDFFENVFSNINVFYKLVKGVDISGSQNITVKEFAQIAHNHHSLHKFSDNYSIITTGTDNIEFMQLFLSHIMPDFQGAIILTGAMVPIGGIGKQGNYYDGIINLQNAVFAFGQLKDKLNNHILTLFEEKLYIECHKQNVIGVENAFSAVKEDSIFASILENSFETAKENPRWQMQQNAFKKRQTISKLLSDTLLSRALDDCLSSYIIIDNFNDEYLFSLAEDILVFSKNIPNDLIINKLIKNGKILVGKHQKMVHLHEHFFSHGAFLLSLMMSCVISKGQSYDNNLIQKLSETFKYDYPLFYAEKIGLITDASQKKEDLQPFKIFTKKKAQTEKLRWIIVNQTPQSHDVTRKSYINACHHTKIIFHCGTGNGNINDIALSTPLRDFIYSGGIHIQSTQCLGAENKVINHYREAQNIIISSNYSLQQLTIACETKNWKNLLNHIDFYMNNIINPPTFNVDQISEEYFMHHYYDYLTHLKAWINNQFLSDNVVSTYKVDAQ